MKDELLAMLCNNALATKHLVDAPEQSTSCRVAPAMNGNEM